MTESATRDEPLALTALALVGSGATAVELEERFRGHGATLDPGVAERLLADLTELGLVRQARGGSAPSFVPTTLGTRLVERGSWTPMAEPLRDLEHLRTNLLATIAHQLRTPLTVVRTTTGLLLDPASRPTAEQRRTMLQTIERNAERMQQLIADVLDLSRFRSGSIRLQLRQLDAVELAESVAATITPLAASRRQEVRLISASPAGDQRFFGDRLRLEQALINLASNAHKFAPDEGRVDITVEQVGETTRWSVADDGPGIPEGELPQLFERFFVGRNDRHGVHQGVGLGLPIALAIAQAHGGGIDVRSVVGQGSTFTLWVPTGGPPEEA